MIAKKFRFTRREFEKARKKTKRFSSGDFLFFYAKSHQLPKMATVISKKVEKSAARRNAFRRRTYDFLGQELIELKPALLFICLYKGQSIPKNTTSLESALTDFKGFLKRKKY